MLRNPRRIFVVFFLFSCQGLIEPAIGDGAGDCPWTPGAARKQENAVRLSLFAAERAIDNALDAMDRAAAKLQQGDTAGAIVDLETAIAELLIAVDQIAEIDALELCGFQPVLGGLGFFDDLEAARIKLNAAIGLLERLVDICDSESCSADSVDPALADATGAAGDLDSAGTSLDTAVCTNFPFLCLEAPAIPPAGMIVLFALLLAAAVSVFKSKGRNESLQ